VTQRLNVFQALLIIYLRISLINTNDVKLLRRYLRRYISMIRIRQYRVCIRLPSYIRIHACLLG